MNTQRNLLIYGGLALALAAALNVSPNSYPYDGDAGTSISIVAKKQY